MSWNVYKTAFGLSLQRQMAYRTDFVFAKIRDFIVFASLLFLYGAIPAGIGSYSQGEMQTYIFVAAMLTNVVFNLDTEKMANEIADGDVAKYLLKPLSFFGYWISTSAARRVMYIGTGVIFVLVLRMVFLSSAFFIQTNPGAWMLFIILFIGGTILSQLIAFLGAFIAFWVVKSHGIRWVIHMLIQFFSGLLIPIDALPSWMSQLVYLTPFPFLVSAPVNAYLGRLQGQQAVTALIIEVAWIAILLCAVYGVWSLGLKKYDAYGR